MHGVVGRHQEHNRRKYDDADEAQESEEPPGLENKGLFGFIFFHYTVKLNMKLLFCKL